MKKNYFFTLLLTLITAFSYGQDLIITGAFDGPNAGGTPKGVELFVVNNIADLSVYGIGSANNGGGSDGEEFTFPADAVTAGTYIYVASEDVEFAVFFGFAPTYNGGSAMGINGDDAIELFKDGTVIDTFGDIAKDGTGEDWDHVNGWAYRKDGTTADGTFNIANWTFSGTNQLVGGSTNSTTSSPFPIGTYSPTVSSTPEITVSSAVSGLDYFEGNGPSSEKSLTAEAVSLTADITVTAPTNFEVSLTSGGTFTNSVTLAQTSGVVNSTTVYVRLKSGLTVNSYSGDVSLESTGATSKTVSLSGEVNPADPQFYYTAFLDDFNYILNSGPSSEQTFTVEGLFLTSNLVVSAPTNYEVSLSTGTGFSSSVAITPTAGTVAETMVYVRLKASLTEGAYSEDITLSSTGVADKTFTLNGNVFGEVTKSMIITGVYDGPLPGGNPKGVELYVFKDIADLSLFGVSSVSNGTGSTAGNVEYSFPADAVTAGTFIYVAVESTEFTNFFGFAPTYTTGTVAINGDDSIELYENGQIIDVFGDVDTDGTGEAWDHVDGWAYRNANSQPGGTTFTVSEWTYSGINAFDGESTNATATTPFPTGTFTGTLSTKRNAILGFATYPNPITNHQFTVTTGNNSKKEIAVYNLLGKQVLSTSFNGTKATIGVANVTAGIYILKVTENDKTATRKLVIK